MAELKAKYTLLHDTVVRYAVYWCGDISYYIYSSYWYWQLCYSPQSRPLGKDLGSSSLRSDTRNYGGKVGSEKGKGGIQLGVSTGVGGNWGLV